MNTSKAKIFAFFLITIFLPSFLLAMGENPIRKNNISQQVIIKGIKDPEKTKKLTDQKIKQPAKDIGNIFIDLKKFYYLDTIELFQNDQEISVKLSNDIINWKDTNIKKIVKNNRIILDFNGAEARYVKIINANKTNCSEIAIYPLTDYQLKFTNIETFPTDSDCEIKINTNYSVLTQAIYGYNYDFIYEKKLDFAVSSLTPGKEHSLKITNLKPQTTYRYQIKVTDFNNKNLYSNYFTFTTLEKK